MQGQSGSTDLLHIQRGPRRHGCRRLNYDFCTAEDKQTRASRTVLWNDHNGVLNNQRMLLASQRGLDLFQAIDVFLQAGDVILHFYEG